MSNPIGEYNNYGGAIGILILETKAPRIPGDIGNLTTYNFSVKYKIVKGVNVEKLIIQNDQKLLIPLIEAARELEKEGVKALTGSCGFLAIFQKEIADAVEIPVFTSSLIQVPLVYNMLGKNKKIGIITAHKEKLTEKHLEAVGIVNIPICIVGMENQKNFSNMILKQQPFGDIEKVEKEILEVSKNLIENNSGIGAIVLECTNMPPYAEAIQKVINLPVFDIVTLINYVYMAVDKKI